MARLRELLRNPFSFLTARSGPDDRLAQYVIREHQRGRSLDEILQDRYIVNRTTEHQRARLLDQPEVVRALGEDTVRDARNTLQI